MPVFKTYDCLVHLIKVSQIRRKLLDYEINMMHKKYLSQKDGTKMQF